MGLHQKALDRLEDVVCFVNNDAEIIFVNKSIEKFGMKREEVIGKKVTSIFPFLGKNAHKKIFFDGLKNKKWVSYKGGKYYLVIEGTILEKNVAMIVMKDMTKFKDNEKKLEEVKKLYEKILEIAHEGIYIENEEGEIIFANNAFSKMVGCSIQEIIGKKIESILKSNKRRKMEDGKYEMNIQTKNGEKTLISTSHSFYENKNFVGKINISLDITEEKRREEKLKILMEREKNFRLKTAHYFFNPLAIAKGYMGLMAEEVEEREKEKVLKAIHAISRVENVIKNFVTRGEIAE